MPPGPDLVGEAEREVAGEGRHDVARVLGEALDLGEEGHGARHLGLGEEAEDAELGRAAVEELDLEAARLLLRGLAGGAAGEGEGVPEVEEEVAAGAALALDGRVVARLAAAHVVDVALGRARALAVRLEHADEREDLELAVERDVVPLLLG